MIVSDCQMFYFHLCVLGFIQRSLVHRSLFARHIHIRANTNLTLMLGDGTHPHWQRRVRRPTGGFSSFQDNVDVITTSIGAVGGRARVDV